MEVIHYDVAMTNDLMASWPWEGQAAEHRMTTDLYAGVLRFGGLYFRPLFFPWFSFLSCGAGQPLVRSRWYQVIDMTLRI